MILLVIFTKFAGVAPPACIINIPEFQMPNHHTTVKSGLVVSNPPADHSHEKKSSENVILRSITTTIFSLVELVDLVPKDDPRASLLRIVVDRLEGDLAALRSDLRTELDQHSH